MQQRRTVTLTGEIQRQTAKRLIDEAAIGDVVRISKQTRSGAQNDLMWSLIADIMANPNNERPHWSPESWKAGFMQYCGHAIRRDQGLGDCGPLPVGFRSSQLTVREMAALITAIYEYGASHGIVFTDKRAA